MTSTHGPYEVRLTEAAYLRFWRHVCSASVKRMLLYGGLAVVLVSLVALADGQIAAAFFGPLVTGLGFLGLLVSLLWFWLWPTQAKKIYCETASYNELQSLTIRLDGFQVSQRSGEARLNWADAVKWDETDTMFVVFSNRITAYVWPKSDVGELALEFARQRLAEAGLPQKGKSRK